MRPYRPKGNPKNFIGRRNELSDDMLLDTIESGVDVSFRKCTHSLIPTWKNGKKDYRWGVEGTRWERLTPERLELIDREHLPWDYWWEIAYSIPNGTYELLLAHESLRAEEVHQQIEADYKAFCEERQRKIDAYLKKYPWKGEPEYYQEGIDWFVDLSGDNGPVFVDCTGRRR